eukprot:6179332-Pleurochrysis_carterae.AAC.1
MLHYSSIGLHVHCARSMRRSGRMVDIRRSSDRPRASNEKQANNAFGESGQRLPAIAVKEAGRAATIARVVWERSRKPASPQSSRYVLKGSEPQAPPKADRAT